ncbi:MAG: hypothetical protein ACRDTM_04900 [Micromonosporaceae bacterium]
MFVKRLLIGVALTVMAAGLVAAPAAASDSAAPPAPQVATPRAESGDAGTAACSIHVGVGTPYSFYSGRKVHANWSFCFSSSGTWETRLQRKRWYGWQTVNSVKFYAAAYNGYSGTVGYWCDGQGTYTYRQHATFYNSVGTWNWYSYEARIGC